MLDIVVRVEFLLFFTVSSFEFFNFLADFLIFFLDLINCGLIIWIVDSHDLFIGHFNVLLEHLIGNTVLDDSCGFLDFTTFISSLEISLIIEEFTDVITLLSFWNKLSLKFEFFIRDLLQAVLSLVILDDFFGGPLPTVIVVLGSHSEMLITEEVSKRHGEEFVTTELDNQVDDSSNTIILSIPFIKVFVTLVDG